MESRYRKKLMITGAAVAIVLVAAFTFLISQSSRIVEQRLEQVLGENFKVKSLSLSWNRIELNEPRFMKDGQITAKAKRIILKPETLALLKPGFPISSVVLEEPSLTLQIDKHGQWVAPFVIGGQPGTLSASKLGPVSIQEIEVKEGTLFFQDQRLPEPNRIEFRKINLSLARNAFPLEDRPSTFAMQMQLAGNRVSGSASGSGTIHFKPLAVDGRFEGQDLIVLDGGAAGPAARVQSVSFTAATKGTAAKGLLLQDLVLVKPYLRLESDRKGRLISPLPVDWPKAPSGEKEGAPAPMELKNLKIEGGELLFVGGKAARQPEPSRIEFRKIDLSLDRIAFPLEDVPSTFALQVKLAGNRVSGSASGKGTIRFKPLAVDGRFEGQDLVVLDGGAAGPAARVQSVSFTAATKGTAAKGLLLQDLVLVKPYLRLESDREGKISFPLPVGWPKAPPGEKEAASAPMELKNLKIEGGELLYLGGEAARRPEPNRIELQKIDLSLDRVAFPLDDGPSTFALQVQLAGNRVTGSASGKGTIRFKPLAVDGRFEGQDLLVLDGDATGPAARVQSVSFTAASKGTEAKGLLLSDLVLVKPYLRLESDREGKISFPLPVGWPKALPGEKDSAPLEVKNLKIEGGELLYLDGKAAERPQPSRIEFQKINLILGRFAYPLEDGPSTFALQVQLAGNRVTGSASGNGTIRFKPLAVDGRFEGQDLIVLDEGAAGPAARLQSVSFTAASKGTAAKGLLLSDLVLVKPYLRLESDREGKILSPLPVGWSTALPGEKDSAPLELRNLKIEAGELLYLDGKAAQPPVPLSITGIDLTADQLSFPAGSQNTTYRLSARLPGNRSTGVLTSSGNTALKTLDTDAKFSLSDLDLTSYKTYVLKEGDADISRGFFDLDMDLGIKKRMLNAPAHSVLRDIRFVGGSDQGDRFLGLPRDLVVRALQNNNNQLSFDFILEGSLDSPEFSLRERMITRLTVGLARRLGLSVVETGGKVIIKGGEIIKGVGNAITKPFE